MYTKIRKAAKGDKIPFILKAQWGATVNNDKVVKSFDAPTFELDDNFTPAIRPFKITTTVTTDHADVWAHLFDDWDLPVSTEKSVATTSSSDKRPRGRRNNNWGNIRLTNVPWQGKVTGTDTDFETFATAEDGIRAAAKQIQTYIKRDGIDTISGIINKWAPSSENNTTGYIQRITSATGYTANEKVNANDTEKIKNILKAIFTVELGQNLTPEDLATVDRAIDRV